MPLCLSPDILQSAETHRWRYIPLSHSLIQVIEDATYGYLLLGRFDCDGNTRLTSQWIHAEYRAQGTEEGDGFLYEWGVLADDVIDNHYAKLFHKVVQVLSGEYVKV